MLDAGLFVVTGDHERNGRAAWPQACADRCRISALRKCAFAAFTKPLRYRRPITKTRPMRQMQASSRMIR